MESSYINSLLTYCYQSVALTLGRQDKTVRQAWDIQRREVARNTSRSPIRAPLQEHVTLMILLDMQVLITTARLACS